MKTEDMNTMRAAIQEMTARLERMESLLKASVRDVMTTRETAEWLGISAGRLRHIMTAREIPCYKKGGKAYFRRSELEDWFCSDKVMTRDDVEHAAGLVMTRRADSLRRRRE